MTPQQKQNILNELRDELFALEQRFMAILEQHTAPQPKNAPTANVTPEPTPVSAPAADTVPAPVSNDKIGVLAALIKEYEGWYAPSAEYPNGSISWQCNNPANAKWAGQAHAIARSFTIKGVLEIFAHFETYEYGWQYLVDGLTLVCKGESPEYNDLAKTRFGLENSGELSLNQFFELRDPPADMNEPSKYAAAAGHALQVDPAVTKMKDLLV